MLRGPTNSRFHRESRRRHATALIIVFVAAASTVTILVIVIATQSIVNPTVRAHIVETVFDDHYGVRTPIPKVIRACVRTTRLKSAAADRDLVPTSQILLGNDDALLPIVCLASIAYIIYCSDVDILRVRAHAIRSTVATATVTEGLDSFQVAA